MSEFFQTGMGQKFFSGTLPALVRAVERLAKAMEKNNELIGRANAPDHAGAVATSVEPQVGRLRCMSWEECASFLKDESNIGCFGSYRGNFYRCYESSVNASDAFQAACRGLVKGPNDPPGTAHDPLDSSGKSIPLK